MKFNWFKKRKISDNSLNSESPKNIIKEADKDSVFLKLKKGLLKTRKVFTGDLDFLFKNKRYIDDSLLDRLEELLITSDIGVDITLSLIDKISSRKSDILSSDDLKYFLRKELVKYVDFEREFVEVESSPKVVMVVGVNGVGKTTSIGKLSSLEVNKNRKVLVIAADTFRAAAVEQVTICAKKAGARVINHGKNTDPASVAYDGIAASISRGAETVFIDTAGRLHTKNNLLEELKKIKRAVNKKLTGAPHEIFLVLDATVGQNSISQVQKFNEALDLTGIILTKLDGSSKGGVVVNICNKFSIPVRYIGIGEDINDLQEFNPGNFVKAIL